MECWRERFTETKTIPYSTETWEIGSTGPISRSERIPRTWNGIIDEVEAFKVALSQTAIQSIYKKGSVGKCKAPVVLTPTGLTFAEQNVVTTSPPRSITVVNNRNNAITIDGFSFTGTDPEDFAESSTTCGSTLAGRKSCTVDVTFTQQASGKLTAVLNANDNAPGSPQTALLSGGMATVVKLNPKTLGFACLNDGPLGSCGCTPPQQTAHTDQRWEQQLDITDIAISGSSTFSQTNTCNTSLAAGSSCAITVTWSHGTGFGLLSISDNGRASPQTVFLRGLKGCYP